MKNVIAITSYHSLKDPIIEGLLLRYLRKINENDIKFSFLLMTFEQTQYQLSYDEQIEFKKELETQGIIWKPFSYRTGGPFMLLKKTYNFLSVFWYLLFLRKQFKPKIIMGFTSISGAIASVLGRILGKKIFIYCFEPHSEYQIDFGLWSRRSLNYQILNYLEKFQVRISDRLIVPTKYGVDLVRSWGRNGPVEIMPVSVDEKFFKIDHLIRNRIRDKLSIANNDVVLYLGKFGGIYYSPLVVARFYAGLYSISKKYHFLVITSSNINDLGEIFSNELPQKSYTIMPPIPYSQIVDYLNAADLGTLAVPSLPSQKYRTPIKTANYLLCGLPYFINEGVAEDDLIAHQENVGVVGDMEEITKANEFHQSIQKLLKDPGTGKRCRKIGLKYRKLSNTTKLLENIFTEIV